jgi:hypothetical protein
LRQEFGWDKSLQRQRMTRSCGQQAHKGHLRPTISFPERVDRVKLGQKVRGSGCIDVCGQAGKELRLRQNTKQPLHFVCNELRIAKRARPFCHANGAIATGPPVYVPKEVTVNPSIVAHPERATR